jgi:hypothetical protein
MTGAAMKLVAPRILPALTGLAFLMLLVRMVVRSNWQRRNCKRAGRGTAAGRSTAPDTKLSDPDFGPCGSSSRGGRG